MSKILKFYAENLGKISVVELSPNGEDVIITGPNESGKSTILNIIDTVLGEGKMDIRKGAEKGRAVITLGDYTIVRITT
jgi:chromosome segregation ATPase